MHVEVVDVVFRAVEYQLSNVNMCIATHRIWGQCDVLFFENEKVSFAQLDDLDSHKFFAYEAGVDEDECRLCCIA